MTDPQEKTFSQLELQVVAERILAALGARADIARLTSISLAKSNLLGHDSHGIIRLLEYSDWVKDGQIQPQATPTVQSRLGSVAIVDGNWGFGQPAAQKATEIAVELGTAQGIGAVAIASCNHIGRLGEYVQRIAEARCVGIAFCNAGPIVAPQGGSRRTFGTNPMAWSAPRSGEEPLVLDFATAGVAEGKVRMSLVRDQDVQDGVLIDAAGKPALHNPGCSRGLNPPVSSSDLAM